MKQKINVIGAGLAGSEAAYQLAKRDYEVHLYEMRPKVMSKAHHTSHFAELVCSNSLRSNLLTQAVGVLKEEMRMMDSFIVKMAETYQVPAGGALAVDRDAFSFAITKTLTSHPNITVIHEEVKKIPNEPTIIATGPLSGEALVKDLGRYFDDDHLWFYDAAAPIIEADSINMAICYRKSRYDKGTADYINCPMNKEEYDRFYEALIQAECTEIKDFELKVFEACMPAEEMARRGKETLLYGPLKPVGLEQEGKLRPHAVVQLRQDDIRGSMYNMVGFQTHLKHLEQKRVFRLIPGLENAEFLRYGVMHRNTFVKSPGVLDPRFRIKQESTPLYLAGQITGVEGYVESSLSGLVAALNMDRELADKQALIFPLETMTGALSDYVAHANKDNFQPMHINFGLVPALGYKHKKKERKALVSERALQAMKLFWEAQNEQ